MVVQRDGDGIDKVLGFVDGFLTGNCDHAKRWEIDLLAVDPMWQAKRIGKSLIETSFAEVERRGADLARDLVRVDNLACRKAFAHSRFEKSSHILALFVCTEAGREGQGDGPLLASTCPTDVDTCLYQD